MTLSQAVQALQDELAVQQRGGVVPPLDMLNALQDLVSGGGASLTAVIPRGILYPSYSGWRVVYHLGLEKSRWSIEAFLAYENIVTY